MPTVKCGECSWSLKVKLQVSQSCLPLCDPMDYTVHGILQVRILEWVAYPFSSGSSWPRNLTGASCIAGWFFTNWAMREALLVIRELKCTEITEEQPQSRNTTIIQYKCKYTKFYLSGQTPFIWIEKCNSFHLASKAWFLAYADTDNCFKDCAEWWKVGKVIHNA